MFCKEQLFLFEKFNPFYFVLVLKILSFFHVLANFQCISIKYQENENHISLNVTFKSIPLIILLTEKDYLWKMFQNILIII